MTNSRPVDNSVILWTTASDVLLARWCERHVRVEHRSPAGKCGALLIAGAGWVLGWRWMDAAARRIVVSPAALAW
jgi:hypothetical protein